MKNNLPVSSFSNKFQDVPFRRMLPWISLISLMFLLNFLNRVIFGPILPSIEEEFAISHASSTRCLLYISLGYSLSMFFSGYSSAKIRPRVIVGVSLVSSGLIMLFIGLTKNFTILSFLFFTLGLAAGQYFNSGLITMQSLVPPAQWSKAISVHEIGPKISFFISPILAQTGASLFGWRGIVSFMGWLSIGAGIVFLLIAKGGEKKTAPISLKGFKEALQDPKLWIFVWLMGLAIAGEFAPYSVLTLYMIDERAISSETTAFLLSCSRVATPFAVLASGFITARLGAKRTLSICLIFYALGMFCLAFPYFIIFIPGLFIQPIFTAMAFPPVFTLLADSFPLKLQPLNLAIGVPLASFWGVGCMPYILGLCGDYASFAMGFIVMGMMVCVSLLLLRRL